MTEVAGSKSKLSGLVNSVEVPVIMTKAEAEPKLIAVVMATVQNRFFIEEGVRVWVVIR
jgi:hypothetical protein